jgi:hypothetical protein
LIVTPDNEWPVNDVFLYLRLTSGMRDDLAAFKMLQDAQAGTLPIACQRYVDGKLIEGGLPRMPPALWRTMVTLEAKDGVMLVVPLQALEPGRYEYTVSEKVVRMLYPAAIPSTIDKETACTNYLASLMKESPKQRKQSKTAYLMDCQAKFPGLREKAFKRSWSCAMDIAGVRLTWSRSGAIRRTD